MKKKITSFLMLLGTSIPFNSWAQVPLVFDVENRTVSACVTTAGGTGTSMTSLPDPFALNTGGRVATFDEWTCRRNQIKSEIEQYEIGPKQPKPASVTATYTGGKLNITSTVNGQSLTQSVTVTVPSGTGPFPVVIGMNSGTGSLGTNLFSGCIQISFAHDQVVSYGNGSGAISASDPFFKLYPSTNIGKYSAWSWGISRIIDGLELTQSTLKADLTKIAVTGCSYAGKMALFGGAFDERIALTIAQESGGGGINSWRMSQQYTARTGVNIEKIDNTNYSWFKSSMKNLNPNTLPYDHHELIAMIAPRALLILGNPTQEWLGDESGYKSTMAAAEVWKAMGISDRLGFVFAPDHSHCSASTAQNDAVTQFVNKFLKSSTTANSNIRVNPTKGTQQDITINSSVFNWTTPTIAIVAVNPNVPKITLTAPTAIKFEAPATITITASVIDANNDVSKVEFFDGTTKLGEATKSPFTFLWMNVEAGTYSITAKATDAANNTATTAAISVSVVETYKIYKITAPLVIDGTLEAVWNNGNVKPLNASKLLTGAVTNSSDLSGFGKLLWDNTYLYFLAEVKDDAKYNDSQNAYDDDAVEFYFDLNNDKAATYGADDVQYSFGWNDGTVVGALPSSGRSTTGITYSVVNTASGYLVEGRIPWSTLKGTPTADQYIGIDFMINDDDNGTGRDGKLAWNAAEDQAWQDASLFGTGVLSDSQLVTANEDLVLTSIAVYPNPAKEFLNVVGIAGVFDYQLLDNTGRAVAQGVSDAYIDLSQIESGIYFLNILSSPKTKMVKIIIE